MRRHSGPRRLCAAAAEIAPAAVNDLDSQEDGAHWRRHVWERVLGGRVPFEEVPGRVAPLHRLRQRVWPEGVAEGRQGAFGGAGVLSLLDRAQRKHELT